ncbi:hypothetical protein [Streptomyces sp. SID13031]|uniref:Mom family adenine methylcarbamoylation protein n=1 Tax=Streptomyces sp. SID13031 TaxID=2706046 RepID=UPI0013CAA774|nr:hypothetical protein [Streptomyces sp. SID13031]NEA32899.1 hypothetical protein [Streptomyces sp. SID13031]
MVTSAAGKAVSARVPTPHHPARFSLADCRQDDSAFTELRRQTLYRFAVESRALTVRTLLHLPRVALHSGTVTRGQIRAEMERNAARLVSDHERIRDLIPTNQYPLPDLRFVQLGSLQANAIFSNLHYLRSARAGSINFALIDPVTRRPVTLCSVSPLEWLRVGRQIHTQFDLPRSAVWDVSRVYSFNVAPVNAISYLLGKVRQVIRREYPAVELLTTAVDPNLGFVGASYRAANWHPWMSIEPRPYLYVDGIYASPRQLRTQFGGANLNELRAKFPGTFEQSRAKLLDSVIYCCRVRRETEPVADELRRRLRR